MTYSNALYLPAIQSNYVTYDVSKSRLSWYDESVHNFLKGTMGLCYPAALYSAGHAVLDPVKSKKRELMIHNRDKDRIMLADSGGFQWVNDTWKTNWKSEDAINKVRRDVLTWQETAFDYAMTLDLPTLALEKNKSLPFNTFDDCLNFTKQNLDFIQQNRKQNVKFLNVLQGRNQTEANTWYKAVKDYDFEGYAIAGASTSDVALLVGRLSQLQKDGELNDKNWVHVLGVGTMSMACILSECQRQLRETTNPNLTISFDTSTASLLAGRYQTLYGFQDLSARDNTEKLTIPNFGAPSAERYKTDTRTLFEYMSQHDDQVPTIVSSRVRLCDLCIGEKGQWDTLSYMLTTNHNHEVMFRMHKRANKAYLEDGLTTELQFFRDHIASDIFKSSDPVASARKHTKALKRLSYAPKVVVEPAHELFTGLTQTDFRPIWA